MTARDSLGPRGAICRNCGVAFTIGNGKHKGCRGRGKRDSSCRLCGEEFRSVKKTGLVVPYSGKRIYAHKMAHFEDEE